MFRKKDETNDRYYQGIGEGKATAEYYYAKACGKEIIYQEEI